MIVIAQKSDQPEIPSLWFDDIVGIENTDIHRGIIFTQTYRVINEFHQYLNKKEFVLGSIIYDHQFYQKIKLRYDIYDDILYAEFDRKENSFIVELDKEKIEKFTIYNKTFRNINADSEINSDIQGFYEELVYNERFSFFKSYKKAINKKLDKSLSYYEFKLKQGQYAIYFQNEYFTIKRNKDLRKILSPYEEEIKRFNKINRVIFQSKIETYVPNLLRYLETLTLKQI